MKRRDFLALLAAGCTLKAQAPTPTHFVDNEVPVGAINGTNAMYTLAHTPNPVTSLHVALNGLGLQAGGYDFTITGASIQFVTASIPQSGDAITATYRY
jgi:hypothetical protein